MITNEYHMISNENLSLTDLRARIEASDMSPQTIRELRSALVTAARLLGHDCLDVPADGPKIMAQIEGLSPAVAGMASQSFANFKSRLRRAFRLGTRVVRPGHKRGPLKGAWGDLYAPLDMRTQRMLSRFFHFADELGWAPEDISDVHIECFRRYLEEEALIQRGEDVIRATIRAWNRLPEELALGKLTPPPMKRTPYWRPLDSFPEGLQADIEAFQAYLSATPKLREREFRKKALRPTTVQQYRNAIIMLASAQVAKGVPQQDLRRLIDVVRPDRVELALDYIEERRGEVQTSELEVLTARVVHMAKWVKAPQSQVKELTSFAENLKLGGLSRRGLANKNKTLFKRLEDEHFCDLVLNLPNEIIALGAKQRSDWRRATFVRTALAVEILLNTALRRANLVQLRLGIELKKLGHGQNGRWIIAINPEDVKNEEELGYELPESTARLLEDYLENYRAVLCKQPSPWLFPRGDGRQADGRSLAADIATKTKMVLGVRVTPHQFRHLSAALYLQNNPEGLNTVSSHLAHRDSNTARRFYAPPQQREASRRYQQKIVMRRGEAQLRLARRRRK